ncbi:NFACT RNA binding domain-containing protein [Algoriphagus hitonicola]
MQEVMDMLDTPLYSIAQRDSDVYLTLLPDSQVIQTFADPIEALNELFHRALVVGSFEKEKKSLSKTYEDQFKKAKNYIQKSSQKLEDLIQSPPPSQLADVIMANLHEFQNGVKAAELFNFYSNEQIKVALKPNQKPQELAAQLYRKSKNRQLEIQQLENTISAKKSQLEDLEAILLELQEMTGFRDLKKFKKEHQSDKVLQKAPEGLPFKQFEIEGFSVWVGKSAKDNDEMLRNFIHKDDLWLHARQVAGSHVIIRKKGNQVIPDPVLERAASLAAYYSKFKTESLAPIIYTEAKYVRKVKGSAPGSVMVDRESVLMVAPMGPDEQISAN